jgi:hypothetical protein
MLKAIRAEASMMNVSDDDDGVRRAKPVKSRKEQLCSRCPESKKYFPHRESNPGRERRTATVVRELRSSNHSHWTIEEDIAKGSERLYR